MGCGGAQGGCAVQRAEAGDTGAVQFLALGAYPTASCATIMWVCINTSLSFAALVGRLASSCHVGGNREGKRE